MLSAHFMVASVLAVAVVRVRSVGSLMAIGGYNGGFLGSAEVLDTSLDFTLPDRRTGHISVTTLDGRILVCGGQLYPGKSGYTASCLQFSYQSNSWQNHSSLLSKYRNLASAVVLSKGVYVLGGSGDSVKSVANSSEFLATGTSNWTRGPRIPGQGVYRSCAAKLSDTELVILGGEYDNSQAIVFNEVTGNWTKWTRLTNGVYDQSCVGLGDKVLMAGGIDKDLRSIGRTVVFDTKTGSARNVTSLKLPRSGASMALYQGKPLILGGFYGTIVIGRGEMWNINTETWKKADKCLKFPRGYFSMATIDEDFDL